MIKRFLFLSFSFLINFNSFSQAPSKWDATEIYEAIQKLNFLGSALYIAAHPDDENTQLISYLSNKVKARTAYLSLTRGDGGQNLIGPEIREMLGVIRTQELLTARKIDGGQQFFTRANDFGYSKHPKETLAIWNKDSVLSDVVWAIRKFRPDIIINRFDHRTPGATHGHHTASAMLSLEAFNMVGDATKFSSQLQFVQPWQPKRVFFNTSWWFYGSKEKFQKADKANLLQVDTGEYFPLRGISNSEIAALSRSQHKSQGFGAIGTRGSSIEYVELIKGKLPKSTSDLFEGIDTSWNRVLGGRDIKKQIEEILQSFDFTKPAAAIPDLILVYKNILKLDDSYWKAIKIEEIKHIIAAASGLFLETAAIESYQTPADKVTLELEAINRSEIPVTIKSISIPEINYQEDVDKLLTNNQKFVSEVSGILNRNLPYTTPYWLRVPGSLGMYQVTDQQLIGIPETPNNLNTTFSLDFGGTIIPFKKQIVYKTKDPVKGEVYQPLEIVPEVSVKIKENVLIFPDKTAKKVPVIVRSNKANISGTVVLKIAEDWKVNPPSLPITLKKKGEIQTVYFTLTPPDHQSVVAICPEFKKNETIFTQAMHTINYEHIPNQTVLLPAVAKGVKLDIKIKGKEIGYIKGAGDIVPESLQQIGYNVTLLNLDQLQLGTLKRYDAIVTGIRAYNIHEALAYKQEILLQYVKEGGNLIIQYNTNRRLKIKENLGPYPLQLSRDRVTDERAKVTLLEPEHPIMNTPNKITTKDFDGWIQERGLYFPDEWSKEYTPLLSMADADEDAKQGALLVAPYGKGNYIYTGLSFFREFPAGVPGAYRLFANLISLGK